MSTIHNINSRCNENGMIARLRTQTRGGGGYASSYYTLFLAFPVPHKKRISSMSNRNSPTGRDFRLHKKRSKVPFFEIMAINMDDMTLEWPVTRFMLRSRSRFVSGIDLTEKLSCLYNSCIPCMLRVWISYYYIFLTTS